MPFLRLGALLEPSATVTRSLRNRSQPLLEQLPYANDILNGKINTYLPRKEEWLLEWLVDRLKDDGADASAGSEARPSPAPWNLLRQLLSSPETNQIMANAILRKHNFLQLLSISFTNAVTFFRNQTVVGESADAMDVDVPEIVGRKKKASTSVASSSATEAGSPVLKFFTPVTSPVRESALESALASTLDLEDLLESIFSVLEFLQGQSSSGPRDESNKRRKLENTTPLLRGTPEIGAGILSSYCNLLAILARSDEYKSTKTEERWSICCFSLWKSCIYGNTNFKKLAATISSQVLLPATVLFAQPGISKYFQTNLEFLLSQYIFQPLKSSHSQIFESLTNDVSLEDRKDITLACPRLLKTALYVDPASKRKPTEEKSSAAFKVLLPLSHPKENPAILASMLDTIIEVESSLDDECITAVLSLSIDTAKLEFFHDSTVRRAAQLNIDAVLNYEGGIIYKFLGTATTTNEELWKLVKVIIDGHVTARNLGGFLEEWLARLKTLSPKSKCLWTLDRLHEIIAVEVEKALNAGQIVKILSTMAAEEPISQASLAIVDCVLRGLRRTESIDKVRASGVCETLFHATVSGIQQGDATAMGWRLILRLLDLFGIFVDEVTIASVVKSARNVLDSGNLEGGKLLLCFQILLLFSAESGSDSSNIIDTFLLMIKKEPPMSLSPKDSLLFWHGRLDEKLPTAGLLTAFTLTIERWVAALKTWNSESRQEFFTTFFHNAILSDPNFDLDHNSPGFTSEISIADMRLSSTWRDMVSKPVIWDLFHYDLISILISQLQILSDKDELYFARFLLIIWSLAECPLEAIRKAQRETLLDSFLTKLHITTPKGRAIAHLDDNNERAGLAIEEKLLVVMNKLMELPNNGSKIASEFDHDKGLGLVFTDADKYKSLSILEEKTSLGRKVLGHMTATKDQPISKARLENVLEKAQKMVVDTKERLLCSLIVERLTLVMLIVTELWKHYATEDSDMKTGLVALRLQAIDAVQNIEYAATGTNCESHLYKIYKEVLELDLQDAAQVLVARSHVEKIFKENINSRTINLLSNDDIHRTRLLNSIAEIETLLVSTEEERLHITAVFLLLLKSEHVSSRGLLAYSAMLKRLDPAVHQSLMDTVTNACLPLREESYDVYSYFTLLKKLIATTKKPDDATEEGSQIWSFTYSQMALALPTCSHPKDFIALAEGLELWIREKSFTLDQFNIDTTFSAISQVASRACPKLTTKTADEIFIPLCNIIRSIISIHRRRIRGRLHLITNTIISLLLCLFKPKYTYQQSTKSSHYIHPHWLLEAYSTSSTLPTSQSAIAFSRVLSTLYDPTAYSVGNRSGSQLTSTTALARKSAGRHVTYVLLQFIHMQLNMTMDAGVRNSLNPGLWAMFDVMDSEMLRKTNAALDGQGRVLFKGLYEQWGKFGKWKE